MVFSSPAIGWLLEDNNPGVRYVTLRDLVGASVNDSDLKAAKKEAYTYGPIGKILEHMDPKGFWVKPGAGYNPKYFSGVWSLILLSQVGAKITDDDRIKQACQYYLEHAFSKDGSFSYNGTPSGTVCCLEGNMCRALLQLGSTDKRLLQSYEWMARSVIGSGVKYYAYTCGPGFACGANGKKPCAWGAVKVMLAFAQLPGKHRTPLIKKAINVGADFLLRTDPTTAAYPTRNNSKPNRGWWTFGFPVFYMTDILQIAEALVTLGYGKDPRLKNTIEYIKSKADDQGRWQLEYDYAGKTWVNFGEKGKPNKWVTYRVLKMLKSI